MTTATLLSAAALRDHVETDLANDVLQRILDAEESEIIRRYGAHATQVDTLPGGHEWLILRRTPSSFSTVVEVVATTSTTLATTDYRHWGGGRLQRLNDGTNQRSTWGERVTVTYVPEDRTAQRRLALAQLAALAIRYEGVHAESIGGSDYSVTNLDYRLERERLLASLATRGGMWFA